MQFEFDPIKAHSNLLKHRVSFSDAEQALRDGQALTIEDGERWGTAVSRRWAWTLADSGPVRSVTNERENVKKFIALSVACIALTSASMTALADASGTAAEARAMLEKAATAVKADRATALSQMAKGEAGFRDRDLYAFCGGADGIFSAHPSLIGKQIVSRRMTCANSKTLAPIGDPIGREKLYDAAGAFARRSQRSTSAG